MTVVVYLWMAGALAQGFDASGPDAPPDDAELADPVWGWGGTGPTVGSVSARVSGVDGILEREVVDGGDAQTLTVLDDLVGLHLGGSTPLADPIGLAVSVPVWVAASGDAGGGPALGDLRVMIPLDLGPGLAVVPQLRFPTGASARFLGGPGPGGAIDASGAVRLAALALAADVGLDLTAASGLDEWPGGLALRGTGSAGWVVSDAVSGHVEARLRRPLASEVGTPSELGVHVKARPDPLWWLSGGLSSAVTRGVGAPRWRAQLTVGYRFGEPPTDEPVDDRVLKVVDADGLPVQGAVVRIGRFEALTDAGGRVVLPADVDLTRRVVVAREGFAERNVDGVPDGPVALERLPVDVVVRVMGPDGRPAPATIEVRGPDGEAGASVSGDDGSRTWTLPPGTWTVVAEAEGLGRQERTVRVDPTRSEAIPVDLMLAPQAGDGALTLRVLDARGAPVPDAHVRVGKLDLGATATGGDLVVQGLPLGATALVVRSHEGHATSTRTVEIAPESVVEVTLDWAPGTVLVQATGPDGGPAEGLVALAGPEWVPARRLGPEGTARFTLSPGRWRMLVSSSDLGSQERVFEVSATSRDPIELSFALAPIEDGVADWTVRAVDPDGVALADVDVVVDGRPVGATSEQGQLTLRGMQAGFRTVRVEAPGLKGEDQTFEVAAGFQASDVMASWMPGALELVVRTPDGVPSDALVAFDGPTPRPPTPLGADGRERLVLDPGRWTVLVSSPTWGGQTRTVELAPEGGRLARVQVDLLPIDDGGGRLSVAVRDPEGRLVPGAALSLRGVPAGVATDGTAVLQDLALGDAEVEVQVPGLQTRRVRVEVTDDTELDIELAWAPGALQVDVAAETGLDDVLLFVTGARTLPPSRPGPDGRQLLGLEPGTWFVLASSQQHSAVERQVELPREAVLTTLQLELKPVAADRGSLLVQVVDEGGDPVEGLELRRGSEVVGVSSASGAVLVEDLEPGVATFTLSGTPSTAEAELSADIAEGSQRRRVVVPYRPVPVNIAIIGADGSGVPDARVRVVGLDDLDLGEVGADGVARVALVPGTWRITASTDGGGGAETLLLGPGGDPVDVKVEVAEVGSSFARGGVTLTEPIAFDLDQATLRPDASPILDDLARMLRASPDIVRVEVQGHTDDQGGPSYNLELSERRAEVVRDALVQRGVTRDRLEARGYGLMRPLSLDRDPAARARNRRVEVIVLEER